MGALGCATDTTMIKTNSFQFLALGAVLLLAGCNGGSGSSGGSASTSTSTSSTTSTSTSGQNEVAFVTNNASDYWTIARRGTEKAAAELKDVQVDFVIPDDGTAATQTEKVNDLLTKGVKGIAISPVDPTNETELLNTAAKKALVVTQDGDAPNSDRACYIGTDNHAAGMQIGEEIKKAIPNGGDIMVFVGNKDAQNAKERLQGIQDAIKGTKIRLVDVRTDETDRAKAKSNVSDALLSNPNLACLVGIWSYNGPAILSAVKDAGKKPGQVPIVCTDEEADTLQGVKDGYINATIVQQPYQFGYTAIKVMDAYLKGDKSAIPASKTIYFPVKVIDKTNVDSFKADLDKMRAGS